MEMALVHDPFGRRVLARHLDHPAHSMFVPTNLPHVVLVLVLVMHVDWSTYMQQVQVFLSGDLDYTNIKGDTGPIPYPAGHLYLYSALRYLTDQDIRSAQYIFLAFYVAMIAILLAIYNRSKAVCGQSSMCIVASI
jgi:alpha-1,3-mannosyltransferase